MLKRMIRNWLGIATETAIDATPVEVATVTVGPDDMVVLMTDAVLSREQCETLAKLWDDAMTSGKKCAILSNGTKLRVIKREA